MNKTKYFSIAISIFAVVALTSGLELRAIRNENLLTAFEDYTLRSYPVAPVNPDVNKNKDLSMDISKLDAAYLFESTSDIDYSGIFRVKNTAFELTIFKNEENLELNAWIEKFYPLYVFNESNFSKEFSKNEEKKLGKNVISLVSKYKSGYYVSYLQAYNNKVLSLVFLLEHYDEGNIDEILNLMKFKGNRLDNNEFSIKEETRRIKDRLKDYNNLRNGTFNLELGNKKVKADTTYYLPWAKNATYQITQDWGINDDPIDYGLSHSTQPNGYAYDFGLPEGTNILASATGTVSYIKTGETTCGGSAYINKANYIVIDHGDGKSTNYYHLQSVDVAVGQNVKRGQVIGKSGKTGYTAAPEGSTCAAHLHFQRQEQGASYTNSVPVIFAEYPDQPGEGEIPYPTNVTSLNELSSIPDIPCSSPTTGNMVCSNFNTNGPGYAWALNSITINPESNINSTEGTVTFDVE